MPATTSSSSPIYPPLGRASLPPEVLRRRILTFRQRQYRIKVHIADPLLHACSQSFPSHTQLTCAHRCLFYASSPFSHTLRTLQQCTAPNASDRSMPITCTPTRSVTAKKHTKSSRPASESTWSAWMETRLTGILRLTLRRCIIVNVT